MGCDMHCVVEALNKKTGQWECFGVARGDRNYALFSRIADVCNSEEESSYIEPIDAPRGWPADASGPADAWLAMSGLPFSMTWLRRVELESLGDWLVEKGNGRDLWEALGFGHLSSLFALKGGWNKAAFTRYSDLRVLFFFEN